MDNIWRAVVQKRTQDGYDSLTDQEKIIWNVLCFSLIASNEGFVAYLKFTNGESVDELIESLKKIACVELAQEVERIFAAFPADLLSTDQTTRHRRLKTVNEDDICKLLPDDFCIDTEEIEHALKEYLEASKGWNKVLPAKVREGEEAAVAKRSFALDMDVCLSRFARDGKLPRLCDASGKRIDALPLNETSHDFLLAGLCFLELEKDRDSIGVADLLKTLWETAQDVYSNPGAYDMAGDMPSLQKLRVKNISYDAGDAEWTVCFG